MAKSKRTYLTPKEGLQKPKAEGASKLPKQGRPPIEVATGRPRPLHEVREVGNGKLGRLLVAI